MKLANKLPKKFFSVFSTNLMKKLMINIYGQKNGKIIEKLKKWFLAKIATIK